MSTVKWRDVRDGDVVRDASGNDWHVGSEPEPDGKGKKLLVNLLSRTGAAPVWLTARGKDPVLLVERAGQGLDEAEAIVKEAIPAAVTVAESSTAEEEAAAAATEDDPLVLPVIDQPLELRSHLWLCHQVSIADMSDPLALDLTHKRLHEPDLLPGAVPHEHEEK